MSIVKIYNPKFDDFHGEPMVTWRDGNGLIQVRTNLFMQYLSWRQNKVPENEPVGAFWESKGPAVVRALIYCGAQALVFAYADDRRVRYKWFGLSDSTGSGHAWFSVCSVVAEGTWGIGDVRVTVTLPTDEDVVFNFSAKQLADWNKEAPAPPSEPELDGPDKRAGEGVE